MGRPVTHFDGKSYNQRAADKLRNLGGKRFGMNLSATAVLHLEELKDYLPNLTQTQIFEYALSGLLRDQRMIDAHLVADNLDERFQDKEAYVA